MRLLKAFVARSFHAIDEEKVRPILELLDSFAPLGLIWATAERVEIESVSKKVQQKIDDSDVFVGIFTKRHPIFSPDPDTGHQPIRGDATPIGWTAPPWLFQELGYALKAGKKLLLIREADVELPGLQGDLEYIVYDPLQPQIAWKGVHQVFAQVIAQNAGIAIDHLVSGPEPKTGGQEQASENPAAVLSSPSHEAVIERCFNELLNAVKAKDFDEANRIQEEGARLVQTGETDFEDVGWQSLCLLTRAKAGEIPAIKRLHDLSADNPKHRAPFLALAQMARTFGEHKSAGDWGVKAAETELGSPGLRIQSAKDYRAAKLWDLAARQLEFAFKEAALEEPVRADALKEMFWLLKDSGDEVAAFCYGEAALQVLPNDSQFRFSLAYAYGDAVGGYGERDYRDLALVHYRLLARDSSGSEYSRNNLGVLYNHFEAPISAAEQFSAASVMGNALATSNVVRQYLNAGFVDDARSWAEKHKPSSDDDGHVTQALAALHAARGTEQSRIEKVVANGLSHRATLASFATFEFLGTAPTIDGEYQFPMARLKISQKGDAIFGRGEGSNVVYKLTGSYRSRLWRFEIQSEKEGEYSFSNKNRTHGLLKFSTSGDSAAVLEYQPDGEISSYSVTRTDLRAAE